MDRAERFLRHRVREETELGRVHGVHGVNQGLWERLLAAQQAQTALAWRCSHGEEGR